MTRIFTKECGCQMIYKDGKLIQIIRCSEDYDKLRKSMYKPDGFDYELFCPDCDKHLGDGHDCDNCSFCGTDL